MGESALFATKGGKRGEGEKKLPKLPQLPKSPELKTRDLPLIALMIG
jgi:hypothetical protein